MIRGFRDYNFLVKLVLFFAVVIALFSVQDFGVATDAPTQRDHRLIQARAYFKLLGIEQIAPTAVRKASDVATYEHKYYGVSLQYPLVLAEYFDIVFDYQDRFYWILEHFYIHILFLLSSYFFYLTLRKIKISKQVSFLVFILYLIHPRIYAHSFFNIKDGVFLSIFTITTFFYLYYRENSSYKRLFLFSFFSALAINTRMMGILFPAWFILFEAFSNRKLRNKINRSIFYMLSVWFVLILIWPSLWSNPFGGVVEAFFTFSKYSGWQGNVIFNAKLISGESVSGFYTPVWIAITTPILYLLLFVFGLLVSFLKKDSRSSFFVFVVLGSLLAVYLFDSTLYGGWRQMYFIFSSFMVLSAIGMDFLYKNIFVYRVLFVFVFINILFVAFWMYKNYPFYHLYFNIVAGNWGIKWDRDYWRLSAFYALKYLAANYQGEIVIYNDRSVTLNSWMLSTNDRDRLVQVDDLEKAQFLFADYRGISGEYPKNFFAGFGKNYTITVDGIPIMTIYEKEQ